MNDSVAVQHSLFSPTAAPVSPEFTPRYWIIGRVRDECVYSVEMAPGCVPHRRDVDFLPCNEASILPLISVLDCITDKKRCGATFHFGILEIKQSDYEQIARVMLLGAA